MTTVLLKVCAQHSISTSGRGIHARRERLGYDELKRILLKTAWLSESTLLAVIGLL